MRADAQRNVEALLRAAKYAFTQDGVDAPAKQIADAAGVGVGTLYRHFPKRSDLVVAVLEHEIDATADAAGELSLDQWLMRYAAFLATKKGFAAALHSGDPAYADLPAYFFERLGPALESLLDGVDADPQDLLRAVAHLSHSGDPAFSQRMVALLIDGLYRNALTASQDASSRRSTA